LGDWGGRKSSIEIVYYLKDYESGSPHGTSLIKGGHHPIHRHENLGGREPART